MIGHQDVSAAAAEPSLGKADVIELPDPAVCRIDQFVDREVEITRCLASGNCPHRRAYLGNRICSYPNIAAELAGAAVN